MAKEITDKELSLIEQCVSGHLEGIGVSGLEAELSGHGFAIQRRTLLRRLTMLNAMNRIALTGEKKGRAYQPVKQDLVVTVEGAKATASIGSLTVEIYVPLSSESEGIKAHVRQPRQMRKPVGYNQEFLEAYYPNETWYLPLELREQ